MIKRFPYIRAVINRPVYYYAWSLLNFAPVHLCGLVAVAVFLIVSLARYCSRSHKPISEELLIIVIFSVWPLAFLIGLTALGWLGAGYQLRFLVPMLPSTAIVTTFMTLVLQKFHPELSVVYSAIVGLSSVVTLCLGVYYGLFYAPFFADVSFNLMEIVGVIILSPYHTLSMKSVADETTTFMKHFGMKL
jgi:hypothetical protein